MSDSIEGRARPGEEGNGAVVVEPVYVTVRGEDREPLDDRGLFSDEDDDDDERMNADDEEPLVYDDGRQNPRRAPRRKQSMDPRRRQRPRLRASMYDHFLHPVEGCQCVDCEHPPGCRCSACVGPPPPVSYAQRIQQEMAQAERHQQQQQQQQQPRYDMRDMQVDSGGVRFFELCKQILLAILGVAIALVAVSVYMNVDATSVYEYRFSHGIQPQGYSLTKSINVTEKELDTGLMGDVPTIRILRDMQTHLKLNESLTCLCMHHLTGFMPTTGGVPVPPRRVCAVHNSRRVETDFLANPVVIRQSKFGTAYSQRSRACPQDKAPVSVNRPKMIWLEWDALIVDKTKPEGSRFLEFYGRFADDEAACLALALEEMDGKMRCGD